MRVERADAARVEQGLPSRSATSPTKYAEGWTRDMARLQQLAGNRAVASSVGQFLVQRHLAPTMPDEVGEPTAAEPTPGLGIESAVEPGPRTRAGTGTAGAAARTPSRQGQVYERLRGTDTGRWALGIIDRRRIPVDLLYAGVGSFHQGGRIYINRSLSVDAAALTLIHEAQHADTFMSGRSANVQTLSRSAYVARMIADEAEAVVRQIEGAVPMIAAGANIAGSAITPGLINRYRAAFYRRRDELEAADPSLTRAQINARCRRYARDTEVTSWFHDGTFVTSTGGAANVTYSQHYGAQWDAVRNPPSTTPTSPGGS
jgi:hypothetical protein